MAQSASRATARARPARDRTTLYEEITSKIIAELLQSVSRRRRAANLMESQVFSGATLAAH